MKIRYKVMLVGSALWHNELWYEAEFPYGAIYLTEEEAINAISEHGRYGEDYTILKLYSRSI